MKRKAFVFIHKIILVFCLLSLTAISINSFTTYIKNDDLNAFTTALKESEDVTIEKRVIFEISGETAKRNLDKTELKNVYHGAQYYKIIKDNNRNLKVGGIDIIPIQSSFLSYDWAAQHNNSYLKQWISFTFANESNFTEQNGVVISKTLYMDLNLPDTISLSIGKNESIELKVSGFYDDVSSEKLRNSSVYKKIYGEPIFFNLSAFSLLEEKLANSYVQTNVGIILSKEEYTPSAVYSVFKYRSWEKDVLVDDIYSSIFENLKGYRQSHNTISLWVSILSLFLLIVLAIFILWHDGLFTKLLSINPIVFILVQFVSIVFVFGIGKIFKIASLFYISSASVVLLCAIGFCLLNAFVFTYKKAKGNQIENE